ncbi:MAG: sensor domain-containing phosphodiesterase [Hyphomicrobiaceae bacterium]|nr:sensor domain-containing phosphodiesterase [Hyphomicrobiaceae bacterium]
MGHRMLSHADAPGDAPIRAVVSELLWVIVPVGMVMTMLAMLLLGYSHALTLEERLVTRMQQVVTSRARLAGEPLWKMRHDQVAAIVEEILQVDPVVTGTVYDDTGAVIATAAKHGVPPANREVAAPIRYKNGLIEVAAGRLQITYSRETLWSQMRKEFALPAILAVVTGLAAILALKLAAHVYIGRPLKNLTDTIVRSRREGRHYRAVITTQNELGALARAFNELQEANAAALAKLASLASEDALTGLPNRRGLHEQLKRASGADAQERCNIAVHFIDLDDFKAINDTFGHETGDKFLIHVAEQLRLVIGPRDWIARLGGDEFIVVQRDAADEATARALARRILDAISKPFAIHDKKISARASMGIALASSVQDDLEQLPALADIALYHSKARGTGTVSVLSRTLLLAHSRARELEMALQQAFAEGQFEVWFQAQFDMQTGRVSGFEALARWRHPDHGLISPAEFLPLVEKTGNSGRLARFVIEQACQASARLLALGHAGLKIAVNLSPSELADSSLVDLVRLLCERHAVPPSALEIEITEGTLINAVADTSAVIQSLRGMGVSMALDDFGTGYSSLAYLRRFPIDKLKIDKAFIRNMPGDKGDVAVVEIIAMLASTLGLVVVAEGIEREEQIRAVRSMGLQIGQGFGLHRPEPFAGIEGFLAACEEETTATHLRAAG